MHAALISARKVVQQDIIGVPRMSRASVFH
jgi:hypothetical protein